VKEVILLPDSAIQQAQQKLWDVMRVVTEPGGAASFAALLSGKYEPSPGEKICVLLCGANTTAVKF
jgi:threonine dehydratase